MVLLQTLVARLEEAVQRLSLTHTELLTAASKLDTENNVLQAMRDRISFREYVSCHGIIRRPSPLTVGCAARRGCGLLLVAASGLDLETSRCFSP